MVNSRPKCDWFCCKYKPIQCPRVRYPIGLSFPIHTSRSWWKISNFIFVFFKINFNQLNILTAVFFVLIFSIELNIIAYDITTWGDLLLSISVSIFPFWEFVICLFYGPSLRYNADYDLIALFYFIWIIFVLVLWSIEIIILKKHRTNINNTIVSWLDRSWRVILPYFCLHFSYQCLHKCVVCNSVVVAIMAYLWMIHSCSHWKYIKSCNISEDNYTFLKLNQI